MNKAQYIEWAAVHPEYTEAPAVKIRNHIITNGLGYGNFYEHMPKHIDNYLLYLYAQEKGYYEEYIKDHKPVDEEDEYTIRSFATWMKWKLYKSFWTEDIEILKQCSVKELNDFVRFVKMAINSYDNMDSDDYIECMSIDWYVPEKVDTSKMSKEEYEMFMEKQEYEEYEYMKIDNKSAFTYLQKCYAENKTLEIIIGLKDYYKDDITIYDEEFRKYYYGVEETEEASDNKSSDQKETPKQQTEDILVNDVWDIGPKEEINWKPDETPFILPF